MANNVFLSGEKIDLCVPGVDDFEHWASWFNDQNYTKFLEQGKYPNTVELQRKFYQNALIEGRFLTLIKNKGGILLGVISLSDINYEKLTCQVAYVCPIKSDDAVYAPLEALAMVTQHAFDRFGMNVVWAGHSYPGLSRWIQKTEILGYKTSGVFPAEFRHGSTLSDAVRTSVIRNHYLELIKRRNGMLWPGEQAAKSMLLALQKHTSLAQKISDSIKSLHSENDSLLAEIESNERL